MGNMLIFGGGGHARVVVDIIEQTNTHRIMGILVNDFTPGDYRFGYPLFLSDLENLEPIIKKHKITSLFTALGNNHKRAEIYHFINARYPHLIWPNFIHQRATIPRAVMASIGQGNVFMAGVIVNPNCKIGNGCILNTKASLDHDCEMDDFSSLAPGVTVGGGTIIGAYSAICLGANLKHKIKIGEHAVIGMGSNVVKNVGEYEIVYGNPAKFVRYRKSGDPYL